MWYFYIKYAKHSIFFCRDCPGPWSDPEVMKKVAEKRLAWEETLDRYKSALEEQCSDLSPSSSTHLEP